MVKLTIVGRVRDGLPLAQGPRYTIEENNNFLFYKQQAEFILKEISKGALAHSKMTIHIDHHCFKYISFISFCYLSILFSIERLSTMFHIISH